MGWKTIVVGIDDTEASQRALERAADLAQTPDAELVVTSAAAVLTGMAAGHGVGPWDPADSPDEHRAELAHARDYLRGRNVTAEFVLGAGEPSDAILNVAEEHNADLIVVGTREAKLLEHLMSGSVSRAVAKKAHTDVLIVH
ncbi:MAG TPA: universal stress protein [Gaiellaceae bacterium]|nr:universal stress protein [Gaiellaceae bacterium]